VGDTFDDDDTPKRDTIYIGALYNILYKYTHAKRDVIYLYSINFRRDFESG